MRIKDLLEPLNTILSAISRVIGAVEAMAEADYSENHSAEPPRNAVLQLNNYEKVKSINEIFSKKEFSFMPKLKNLHYRYRADGIHEFRYRRNGIFKSFASVNLKTAKDKAIVFIRQLSEQEKAFGSKAYIRFEPFANNYIENVKKVNVAENTYSKLLNRYHKHILPVFRNKIITDIKAPAIQTFLNDIIKKGFHRTAEECFFLLKTIFQYAVDNEFITKNPINAVKIPKHRRSTGIALSIEDEKEFIKNLDGTIYKTRILVLLYTGCRPCELPTAELKKDGFITFRNMKQKNGIIEYKDIPITPMLAPYVENIKKELPFTYPDRMKKTCTEKLKNYRVYDLRHTFATRCQECGVPQEIVARWLGHKSGKITDNTYTHFSPSFMKEQAKKVYY